VHHHASQSGTKRCIGAKQKERLKTLEKVAVSALLSKGSPDRPHRETPPYTQISRRLSPDPSLSPTATEIFQSLTSTTLEEHSKCLKILVAESFTFRDIVKYGLISMGYSMSSALFDGALNISPQRWIKLLKLHYPDFDMRKAVAFGIKVLGQLDGPRKWPTLEWLGQARTNILPQQINLTAMSYFTALVANANHLRVTPDVLMDDYAQSNFCISKSESENDSREDSTRDIAHDLVPTSVQLSLPHHPIIDFIPWSTFRSKYIIAVSTDPPMIDEDDLCLDVMSGGLRCWGSTIGSMNGRGQGAPWDSRSWEAMPWFLEKWGILVGGEDSEISRNSAWWRMMQGIETSNRESTT